MSSIVTKSKEKTIILIMMDFSRNLYFLPYMSHGSANPGLK